MVRCWWSMSIVRRDDGCLGVHVDVCHGSILCPLSWCWCYTLDKRSKIKLYFSIVPLSSTTNSLINDQKQRHQPTGRGRKGYPCIVLAQRRGAAPATKSPNVASPSITISLIPRQTTLSQGTLAQHNRGQEPGAHRSPW